MTLIIIIAAILLERFWPEIKFHQNKNYFSIATDFVLEKIPEKIKSQPLLFIAVLLLAPFFIIMILNLIFLDILGGLIALFFNILLLLVCVRTYPRDEHVQSYIAAQQEQDKDAIANAFFEVTGEQIESVKKPNSYLARFLLIRNVSRWFGVIFYFVLLGPAAVVFYRSLQEFLQRNDLNLPMDLVEKTKAYIEWPISRLMALSFCLSGSFDDALRGWQQQVDYLEKNDPLISGNEIEQSNNLALLSTGCAAIGHDMAKPKHNDTAFILAMQGMLFRTLMIWCAVIAILTLLTDIFI